MSDDRISREDLDAEAGVALPDKEAMSLLDVNAQLDLALDVAAPIDAAIAANAQVAAPINASVSANILSFGSGSTAYAGQDSFIDQSMDASAEANADQTAYIDQAEPVAETTEPVEETTTGDFTDGSLLNVNADLGIDADVAAPIDAAAAVNANVAAPINAAVSANIGSIGSESVALADQSSVINQELDGSAVANATQDATIEQ